MLRATARYLPRPGPRPRRAGGRILRGWRKLDWARWPHERLLDLRFRDLDLTIAGTWLEEPIHLLLAELEARGLPLLPHFWLSEEWFSPADVPGIAIPFYLAHPRLMALERREMLEVEGGTQEACLKILRHEAGHAVQHAYRLERRKGWQEAFGRSSTRYPDQYRPRPASRRFVQHLDRWYAQAHPDEDFAETFAVWLKPRSPWRRRYAGWPALRKLEYVDDLMARLAGERPVSTSRQCVDALPTLRKTLRDHYAEKRERYGVKYPRTYDGQLRRVFHGASGEGMPAAAFLRRHRAEIRGLVSRSTGEHEFALDQVLKDMGARARELKLRTAGPERKVKLDFAILVTVETMHCLYGERRWHVL